MVVSDLIVMLWFHFSWEMIVGLVYRKYEKVICKMWSVEDIDFG